MTIVDTDFDNLEYIMYVPLYLITLLSIAMHGHHPFAILHRL